MTKVRMRVQVDPLAYGHSEGAQSAAVLVHMLRQSYRKELNLPPSPPPRAPNCAVSALRVSNAAVSGRIDASLGVAAWGDTRPKRIHKLYSVCQRQGPRVYGGPCLEIAQSFE